MSNELKPMDAMRVTLKNMSTEFQAALPPQIPTEKFIRTTLTAIQIIQRQKKALKKQKKLTRCSLMLKSVRLTTNMVMPA